MEVLKTTLPLKHIAVSSILALVLGYAIFRYEVMVLAVLSALVVLFFFGRMIYLKPMYGLYTTLIVSFFVNGIIRYLDLPLGLGVDLLLFFSIIIALFSREKPAVSNLNSSLLWISIIWLGFTVLEIFNPEATSKVAWFYAVRAVSIYQILSVFFLLLYLKDKKQVYYFTHLTLICCLVASFWGFKQIFLGLDEWEIRWLASGPIRTHVLFGVLRAFSFLSDSGQFGATMGYGAIVAFLLALGPFSARKRVILALIGFICLYAMALSGTRGAFFVVIGGALAYLISTKNLKSIAVGGVFLLGIFMFLKFTTIGNENYQLRRMRTALNPKDASLQVRLENQLKFKQYLATRPLGGGIGTSGSWGQRFSPNTFLANTPNDSWYVRIWAETGIIGLTLHVIMILYILFKGFAVTFSLNDPMLRQYMMALNSGFAGIAVAAYGNPIIGQFPINIIIYFTWGAIFLAANMDKPQKHLAGADNPVLPTG
ncbi:O-antigen ligase [Algoriphagus sp. Y33]|uniref:O-antigen ligase family protein n=1 Tax=Algoriphagus sp. Y33 TaxID=2772483 RepID=UPI00177AAB2E|nr:O-antigen ligase family protein [Algoriphagus sp. Y33]